MYNNIIIIIVYGINYETVKYVRESLCIVLMIIRLCIFLQCASL